MTTEDVVGNRGQPAAGTRTPASQAEGSAPQTLAIRTNTEPDAATAAAAHSRDGSAPFDIVETYHNLLRSDPDISMPVAAIEALIALLGSTPATTAMETVDVVRSQADRLRRAVANPIPLTAGTDLFQQYLLRSLKGQAAPGAGGRAAHPFSHPPSSSLSFDETRQHLLRNGRLFAARAKAARDAIADRAAAYVVDGSVVLAAGGSRTVRALLLRAAERHAARWGAPRFRVVYVTDGSPHGAAAVAALRARGVPTAAVGPEAVAHALQAARVDLAFVGTEVIVQNGGLLSRIGTLQLATLCRDARVPFYVAAETHKIVRLYPLSQADLPRCGVQQQVLDFRTGDDDEAGPAPPPAPEGQVPVDYTPPSLITAIITEQGVKKPVTVYEMILDMYT